MHRRAQAWVCLFLVRQDQRPPRNPLPPRNPPRLPPHKPLSQQPRKPRLTLPRRRIILRLLFPLPSLTLLPPPPSPPSLILPPPSSAPATLNPRAHRRPTTAPPRPAPAHLLSPAQPITSPGLLPCRLSLRWLSLRFTCCKNQNGVQNKPPFWGEGESFVLSLWKSFFFPLSLSCGRRAANRRRGLIEGLEKSYSKSREGRRGKRQNLFYVLLFFS